MSSAVAQVIREIPHITVKGKFPIIPYEKDTMISEFQENWSNHNGIAVWTKRLILIYINTMRIMPDDRRMHCDGRDTAENIILKCDRWARGTQN